MNLSNVPPAGATAANAAPGLHDWRGRFRVPAPGAYLLAHSTGCLPDTAVAALDRNFLQPWAAQGGDAWPQWLEAIEGFRVSLAKLFDDQPANFCPQPSVSAAMHSILGALPLPHAERRIWLTSEASFPSLGFVLEKARALGYELRLIPAARDPAQPETWLDALAPDVAGVLMMHVHSNTGAVAPVAEVARHCRARGITAVADLAQSAGVLPISMNRLGVDFAIGSCLKWLCGGPGAGYLWVRPELQDSLQPSNVGWFSHAEPFEMNIRSFRYAPGAQRFWGGTPSVAPFVIAAGSLQLINEIGIERIFTHNRALIAEFLDGLADAWRGQFDLARNGGTLCLDAGAQLPAARSALGARSIRFDTRGTRVRLSFHLYNTRADAQLAAEVWRGIDPGS